jgi:hypothetical protein
MMSLENLLTEANTFTEHFFPNNSEPSSSSKAYDWFTSDTWTQNRLADLTELKKKGLDYFKKIIATKGVVDEDTLEKAKADFLKLTLEEQNERIKDKDAEAAKALKELRENNDKIIQLETDLAEAKKKAETKSITSVTTLNETSGRILPAPGNPGDDVATMKVREPTDAKTT